ncbi:MAG: hypothetical protein OXR07_06500 [Nitrospira sp.]|nr:hypothetical protein [Nitrospira sp.]MDD9860341.1 hypothetical protein [Nitrospira sp.]
MIRKKTVLVGLLVSGLFLLAAGFLLYPTVHHFIRVDYCLDGGGCWDEVDNVCRMEEINAQELCDRAPEKTGIADEAPTSSVPRTMEER